jgi:hypothetical protein
VLEDKQDGEWLLGRAPVAESISDDGAPLRGRGGRRGDTERLWRITLRLGTAALIVFGMRGLFVRSLGYFQVRLFPSMTSKTRLEPLDSGCGRLHVLILTNT